MTTLADLQTIVEDTQRQLREQGSEAFKEFFRQVFMEHPELEDIRWRQYTPYFNDGDACVFGVYDPYFKIRNFVPAEEYYCDYEDDRYLSYYLKEQFPWVEDVAKTILSDAFEQIALLILGDHSTITVTPNEIQITEYEHD